MSSVRTSTTDDVVVLEGDIDLAVADDVLTVILAAAERGTTTVDLSGVTFIDSSGLNALLVASRELNGDGPLRLRSPSRSVRRLLDLALPTGAPGVEVHDA
jgi:anti-anti-sigma factor